MELSKEDERYNTQKRILMEFKLMNERKNLSQDEADEKPLPF